MVLGTQSVVNKCLMNEYSVSKSDFTLERRLGGNGNQKCCEKDMEKEE